MLVYRTQLQSAQFQALDSVIELLEAAGICRIDRSPAFDLLRMRGRIIGDDLVGHPDAGSFCLQPENDDFVHGLRDAPVVIRLGVIAVFSFIALLLVGFYYMLAKKALVWEE